MAKLQLPPDFSEFLSLLNSEHVEYLLLGGYAVAFYGGSTMATLQLPADFSEFLSLLNSEQVEYLLLGGYAVAYYGLPRATGDMDVWFNPAPDNTVRLVRALASFGFLP